MIETLAKRRVDLYPPRGDIELTLRKFGGRTSEVPMPFLSYKKLSDIENTPKVSTGSCASLVQYFTRVGPTSLWKEGATVRGNMTIKRGTAIATFVDGKYPNNPHDNHAALYVSQNATGIEVLDQWEGKTTITKRTMKFKGKFQNGTYVDPSNNGDAMSIIEH